MSKNLVSSLVTRFIEDEMGKLKKEEEKTMVKVSVIVIYKVIESVIAQQKPFLTPSHARTHFE